MGVPVLMPDITAANDGRVAPCGCKWTAGFDLPTLECPEHAADPTLAHDITAETAETALHAVKGASKLGANSTTGGPTEARLREILRLTGTPKVGTVTLSTVEAGFLLAEVGRLSEENGRLRERIAAALDLVAPGARQVRHGELRSVLSSGVPGEAGKK